MSKNKYDKSFFIAMNMQNPPRPDGTDYYIRYKDENSVPEYTVLNYEYTKDLRPDSFGVAEGASPINNFRKAFLPEDNHYIVSRDFSGQELRILANLSGEQSWIDTFLSGGDIHRRTAETVWGKENYTPDMRKKAKAINFGLVYGIGAPGLSSDLGVSEKEAQSYIDTFFNKHPNIHRYLQRQARVAGQNDTLANHYGRHRRFHIYKGRYGGISPAGERRAFNFPIQSMGADITKLGILNVYYNIIKNPKFEGKALWMSTIHDEINLSVHKDILEEVVFEMGRVMTHIIQPNYPVPVTTGLEIGNNMGMLFEFEQDSETKELKPVYDKLEETDRKIKDKTPSKYTGDGEEDE